MIFEKVMANDLTYVKENINLIKTLDKKNRNLLYYAIIGNAYDVLRFLLDTEIDINNVDLYGENVLFTICQRGKVDMAKLLISKHINVNLKNRQNETPLHIAATKGNLLLIRLLLESFANEEAKTAEDLLPLHYAVLGGNIEVFEYLFEKTKKSLYLTDSYQNTLLHFATRTTNINIIQYLLNQGLNPNTLNSQYETPLFNAVKFGTKEIVLNLLEEESFIEIKNRRYESPLDLAKIYEKEDILNTLEEYMKLPKYINFVEKNQLTLAVLNRDLNLIERLVNNKEPLNKDRFNMDAKSYAKEMNFKVGLNLLNRG